MKKKKLQCSVPTLMLAGVLCLTLAACGAKQSSDMPASDTESAVSTALPVKAMNAKRVDENPYMAKSDANIHHDGYNTDSTDEVLPLGIYPEINVSYEKTNANASPAIYFDSYGHAVVPLLGGIAIRDLNAEETTTLGYFSPKQHDGGGYVIQSSYTFLDSENHIVCPTSNNHVLMLRATDEAGNVLPEFEKVLDIDIKAAAEAALGKELTQNLLSVVFDYDGNLWFATGGFRIYPEREQQGVLGYIAHSAIEAILNGEQADLSKAVFVYGLALGEGAENGIAASKDGAVILTNQNCYLLRANNGVEAVWCTPYESVGAKVSGENDKTTGGGLAWGGGCSPSLTPDLVMFTDNADPVKLLALDMKTGEIVASMPVLDDLPEGYQVAVDNSAIVYDDSEGTVSTIVCNWFGAGSAGLADPDSDSSIQSYANIYDTNWLTKGNCMIAPGVERVDTVKTDSGYEMKSIWSRNDLSDTSILKLSTATGYIYGAGFFGRYIRRSEVTTLPEYFGRRFCSKHLRRLSAVILLVSVSAYLLSAIQGVATLMSSITGYDYRLCAVIVWLAFTAFTIYSGSPGVLLPDTIMFLVFLAATLVAVPFLIRAGGGWFAGIEALANSDTMPGILSWAGNPDYLYPDGVSNTVWAVTYGIV